MNRSIFLSVTITLALLAGMQIGAAAEGNQSIVGQVADSNSSNLDSSNLNCPFPFIGNSSSMKFHRRECEFACIMAVSRQVPFQNRRQAVMAGMKPCNWCLPIWSTNVQGRLLLPEDNPAAKSTGSRQDSNTKAACTSLEAEAKLQSDCQKQAE